MGRAVDRIGGGRHLGEIAGVERDAVARALETRQPVKPGPKK